MVAERIVPHEEQAALCLAARGGNPDAANKLALAVWPWVRRKAGEYGRRYRVDADELEGVGLARLPYAVRSYDPAEGTFLNYYANCASREMLAVARDEADRAEVSGSEAVEVEPQRTLPAGTRDEQVRAALDSLDPVARQLVLSIEGYDGEPVTVREAGRRLGISSRRAHRLYKLAFNRLSDLLAG